MRYALVRNNIVENIVRMADDIAAKWVVPDGVTLISSATANIGDAYDGINFIPPAAPLPDPRKVTINQIAALESTVTQRRIRDAVLGVDGGWLRNIETEISALRGTL